MKGENYCLGGSVFNIPTCGSCQWLKNWNELNEFEYDERHELQDDMTCIDSMKCQLTEMGAFQNKDALLDVPQKGGSDDT